MPGRDAFGGNRARWISAKAAFGYLRRAMAPVAAWTTDEGVNGVAIHLANDLDTPRPAMPLPGDSRALA